MNWELGRVGNSRRKHRIATYFGIQKTAAINGHGTEVFKDPLGNTTKTVYVEAPVVDSENWTA